MDLSAVRIGSLPQLTNHTPQARGIVGWNVWLWVEDPNSETYGPITKSVTADGYTVTVTAKVAKIVWDLGNGDTLTCTKGTPYPAGATFRNEESPDCGYVYLKDNTYTITATSHWAITWTGIGQSGTIPMQLTNRGEITIAEVQVLNVPAPPN